MEIFHAMTFLYHSVNQGTCHTVIFTTVVHGFFKLYQFKLSNRKLQIYTVRERNDNILSWWWYDTTFKNVWHRRKLTCLGRHCFRCAPSYPEFKIGDQEIWMTFNYVIHAIFSRLDNFLLPQFMCLCDWETFSKLVHIIQFFGVGHWRHIAEGWMSV